MRALALLLTLWASAAAADVITSKSHSGGSGGVATSRQVGTGTSSTTGLTGGGNLTADRSLSCVDASGTSEGCLNVGVQSLGGPKTWLGAALFSAALQTTAGQLLTFDGVTGAKYLSSNGTTLTLTGLNLAAPNLSGTNSGDVTIGTFGSTPTANGALLSGQSLLLQPADATHPGSVTTGAQTWAGPKTLTGATLHSADLETTQGQKLSFDGATEAKYLSSDGTTLTLTGLGYTVASGALTTSSSGITLGTGGPTLTNSSTTISSSGAFTAGGLITTATAGITFANAANPTVSITNNGSSQLAVNNTLLAGHFVDSTPQVRISGAGTETTAAIPAVDISNQVSDQANGIVTAIGSGSAITTNNNTMQLLGACYGITGSSTGTCPWKTMANGRMVIDSTDSSGSPGAVTINKASGKVAVAAAASSVVVTDSVVSATSIVLPVQQTADSTCAVKSVAPGAGSFTVTMTAACTGNTTVGFIVTN